MGKDNRAVVRRVLLITLLLNLLVMGLKFFVGFLTGSLSLMADALHSVTDSGNNVLGLIANQFASPYPDREHPYGHQKFEAVGALGIAAFLGVACFSILEGAVERIFSRQNHVQVSPSQLWILLIVLGVNIFVAYYERSVGKRVGSPILIADALHTMSDIWVTISVIGGLIGVWLGYAWLDIAIAFPVALMVFWSGWNVIKQNLPWLVDQMAIPPEDIYEIAIAIPGVINVHDIASRGVRGRQVFIEMHLTVDVDDVNTAHQITEDVEQRLDEKYHPVRVVIHVEPRTYHSERISF